MQHPAPASRPGLMKKATRTGAHRAGSRTSANLPLRSDCSRCVGLCCVGLAFDRSPHFAFDKPAGERCPHLDVHCRCAVHAARRELGLSGCIAYDCLGAGQRVTELFGVSNAEELAPSMLEAFRLLGELHEQLSLLREAERLPLTPRLRDRLEALRTALEARSSSREALFARDVAATRARVLTFLRELALFPRVVRALRERVRVNDAQRSAGERGRTALSAERSELA